MPLLFRIFLTLISAFSAESKSYIINSITYIAFQGLRNAHITYNSDGNIRISTITNEVTKRQYLLPLQDSAIIGERRIKFERGIKDRFFDFKIENINGSTLEINSLRVALEPILSKMR